MIGLQSGETLIELGGLGDLAFLAAPKLRFQEKRINLALDFVKGSAVTLLNRSHELVSATGDHIQVVVGELAPFLPDFALEFGPVAFEDLVVHVRFLALGVCDFEALCSDEHHLSCVRPSLRRRLFTVAAAICLARLVERPSLRALFLMCSY